MGPPAPPPPMATIRRSTIAEYGGGASQCARAIEFHITPPTVEVPNARQASAAPAGAHKYSAALSEAHRALAMSDRCRFLAALRQHSPPDRRRRHRGPSQAAVSESAWPSLIRL